MEGMAECGEASMARPGVESVSGMLILLPAATPEGVSEVERPIEGAPQSLIVRRRGADVRGWLNICPHAGRRLDWAPGRFLLDKGHLVCAAHGASFELEHGLCISGPCRGQSLVPVPVALADDDG